jgi:hypothetical protein
MASNLHLFLFSSCHTVQVTLTRTSEGRWTHSLYYYPNLSPEMHAQILDLPPLVLPKTAEPLYTLLEVLRPEMMYSTGCFGLGLDANFYSRIRSNVQALYDVHLDSTWDMERARMLGKAFPALGPDPLATEVMRIPRPGRLDMSDEELPC